VYLAEGQFMLEKQIFNAENFLEQGAGSRGLTDYKREGRNLKLSWSLTGNKKNINNNKGETIPVTSNEDP
jgi:hypothetical protein